MVLPAGPVKVWQPGKKAPVLTGNFKNGLAHAMGGPSWPVQGTQPSLRPYAAFVPSDENVAPLEAKVVAKEEKLEKRTVADGLEIDRLRTVCFDAKRPPATRILFLPANQKPPVDWIDRTASFIDTTSGPFLRFEMRLAKPVITVPRDAQFDNLLNQLVPLLQAIVDANKEYAEAVTDRQAMESAEQTVARWPASNPREARLRQLRADVARMVEGVGHAREELHRADVRFETAVEQAQADLRRAARQPSATVSPVNRGQPQRAPSSGYLAQD